MTIILYIVALPHLHVAQILLDLEHEIYSHYVLIILQTLAERNNPILQSFPLLSHELQRYTHSNCHFFQKTIYRTRNLHDDPYGGHCFLNFYIKITIRDMDEWRENLPVLLTKK